MGIRQAIARALVGDEIGRMQEAFGIMRKAYEVGPYQLPPDELARQLREVDPWTLQDLLDQVQWDQLGGAGYASSLGSERDRAVDDSLRAYRRDVITEFTIGLWTDFGFGQTINAIAKDAEGQVVWNEFWTAKRNDVVLGDDKLQKLSDDTLAQGEVFLTFFVSVADGLCTIREVGNDESPGTKQITKLVTNPDDETQVMFYLREWVDGNGQRQKMYYPDWRAFLDGEIDDERLATRNVKLDTGIRRSDRIREDTICVIMHIMRNTKGGLRGWPLMSAGIPWTRAHKKFREDRAAAASAIAMFVNRLKVKGGSRAVSAMQSRLASTLQTTTSYAWDKNPPPVAGSTWIENEAATLDRLPMGSGASDAKEDGNALLTMAGLGGGVYPHYLGAGDAYRLATATAMEWPMQKKFNRYQVFWASQFRRMVDLVLSMAERYGGRSFETHEATVNLDKLLQSDLNSFTGAIVSLIDKTLVAIEKAGTDPSAIPYILSTVWALAYDALGVTDVEAITPQAFGAPPEQAAEWQPPSACKCPACGGDALYFPVGELTVCESCINEKRG